ncbi:hypothetical protein K32_19410 [Kaistia sp. 32K]|uniref:hypothetical protein n=1 Tax=Kaistia sp. 32K TaxID=2795690 RepID=UPI001916BC81|nr:hypothetical protein [Kaistia sp. 32K]BCP53324.1 hypothetical protein K32_19410 [Kaistia sp. 32K]
MRAVVTSAFFNAVAVGSDARTTLAVIPAKAGIHAAGFVEVGKVVASTPMTSAEWIPAFAGITAEGVGADAALAPRAICDRTPRSAVIPAMTKSPDLQSCAR